MGTALLPRVLTLPAPQFTPGPSALGWALHLGQAGWVSRSHSGCWSQGGCAKRPQCGLPNPSWATVSQPRFGVFWDKWGFEMGAARLGWTYISETCGQHGAGRSPALAAHPAPCLSLPLRPAQGHSAGARRHWGLRSGLCTALDVQGHGEKTVRDQGAALLGAAPKKGQ